MSTKQTPNEVEEVKDLEQVEEVQDLKEVPEEVKEAAPVLKSGGLRGAADPDMIQKHIDNFLAMLCGETPVDSNVRTSAEYWLKRLATGEGSGSTKKIYCHPITIDFQDSNFASIGRIGVMILNNDPTPFTKTTFVQWMGALYAQIGDIVRVLATGSYKADGVNIIPVSYLTKPTDGAVYVVYGSGVSATIFTDAEFIAAISNFTDGVNAIN